MNRIVLGLVSSITLVACSGSSDQIITGHVAPGFPSQITSVRVVHHGAVLASGPVAVDGSFQLSVPAGTGLAFQVVGGAKDRVVFPRQSDTTIHRVFAVRGGGVAFDLGALRYVGASLTPDQVAFHNGPSARTECEDGHDAGGNTCIDDEDSDSQTCDAGDATEGADDATDDTGEEGEAVAEHNFPADGCADDGAEGSDS